MADRTVWQQIAKRIRVPLGFAFAAVFLLLARPTLASLTLSLLLVVPGVLLRGYASGYVRKNAELATTGPYAYTRNPLYLGSMLIAFGFAAAARSWILIGLLAALFAIIYLPTIEGEEQYLRTHFPEFESYAARVPRLFPNLLPNRKGQLPPTPSNRFSKALYQQHHEYNVGGGAGAIYLALALRLAFEHHRLLAIALLP